VAPGWRRAPIVLRHWSGRLRWRFDRSLRTAASADVGRSLRVHDVALVANRARTCGRRDSFEAQRTEIFAHGQRGQHLRRDRLGALPRGQPLACDLAREGLHVVPLAPHRCGTADLHVLADLLHEPVFIDRHPVDRLTIAPLERTAIDGADLALERPVEQRALHAGQLAQPLVGAGEVVKLTRRQARPLARVVGQPCEPQPLPAARLDEPRRHGGQRATQRPPHADDLREPVVDRSRRRSEGNL
jgi:hypothetical protein